MDMKQFTLFKKAFPSVNALIQLQTKLQQPSVKLIPEVNETPEEIMQGIDRELQKLSDAWKKEREDIQTFLYSDALQRRKNVYKLVNLPQLMDTLDDYFTLPDACNIPQELEALGYAVLFSALKKGYDEDVLKASFFALVDSFLSRVETNKTSLKTKLLAQAHNYADLDVSNKKQQAAQLSFHDQLEHLHRAVSNSAALRAAIRERFPIAMIDEFQDTDTIQYEIFSALYKGQKNLTLMMIGDPKQAIYSFRGGDIFTYIRAKEDADEHYTLNTNWRSTHAMIDAVNFIFSIEDEPFLYPEIPFEPVGKPKDNKPLLQANGEVIPALTLWNVPLQENNKPINKKLAGSLMHHHVANEIARLLMQSQEGNLKLGERAVRAGDIAILVQSHAQAAHLREALRQRGIGAVTAGKEHVFESEEAEGLRLILQAILHPKDARLARAALASALMNYPLNDIYQLIHQEDMWLKRLETMAKLHDTWQKNGFMAMFQSMLRELQIGERMASLNNGERRLTNLLHLGELLHQSAQSLSGMEALLAWFEHQCNDEYANEEAQLRLEDDGDLVQISTIHASKGLEYPIVFVPYIWDCKPRSQQKDPLLSYYDKNAQQHCLTLMADNKALSSAEHERLAEDTRLLYVALTRASQKLYLTWGHIGQEGEKAALLSVLKNLQPFQDDAHDGIEVDIQSIDLETPEKVMFEATNTNPQVCQTASFARSLRDDWKISSFTSLTRHVSLASSRPSQHEILSGQQETADNAVFHFPANRYTGRFLHALMEHLDFQGDLDAQVKQRLPELSAHFGIQAELETITAWVHDIVHTPLNNKQASKPPLTLASLSQKQRLNELHFDLSMPHLNVHQLNQTLQAASPYRLQDLQSFDCKGYLTGEIDMAFEHDGRYGIVDYKSNFLGGRLEDYQTQALQDAVLEHRYDVQYLIYSVALHRYLSLRLPNYDYAQHFGGVYYLFLRGMRPEHGCQYGVFAHQPEQALIERLNRDIFGQGDVQ